jgi:hypothetical protein
VGKGTASHAKLMMTTGERALAVEAKWTEPRYETIRPAASDEATTFHIEQAAGRWTLRAAT